MKRFVYLTVVLIIGFMLMIGCRAVWPESSAQHIEEEEFNKVGGSPFVGATGPEARSLSRWTQMSGY